MRINNRIISNNILQNLQRNLNQLSKVQDQMSSGKRVSKPSDDPIGVAQILSFKTTIAEQEQHIKNMEDAKSWIDLSESALDNATAVLQRARELSVYGASDSMPDDSRKALANEADQLVEELVQVANAIYGDRYVFGGSITDKPPFEYDASGPAVNYRGNNSSLQWEVAPGVELKVNATGEEVFDRTASSSIPSMFQAIINLAENLRNGNAEASISEIDAEIDHILSQRAIMGAKSNRLRLSQERMENDQINNTKLMSKLEDVDLAKVSMEYSIQSNVYQAALQTGARIIQPTLLDFLR